ncbi:hypothetical protein VNO77_19940 [Canavalia gladiata]|uniref:Uncharacterized protein n=1 Tax=Canavalia gladiata TaxID=3824 RepID=A0AAN9LS89_CANGL
MGNQDFWPEHSFCESLQRTNTSHWTPSLVSLRTLASCTPSVLSATLPFMMEMILYVSLRGQSAKADSSSHLLMYQFQPLNWAFIRSLLSYPGLCSKYPKYSLPFRAIPSDAGQALLSFDIT